MSLSREETLALAAGLQGLWELMGHLPATRDLNETRDDLSRRRDDLLRQAGLQTGDEEPAGG